MEEDQEGVLFNIRACIGSSKGPVLIRDLMRDYETLVGSPIPYRQLNYPTLEGFLHSLPSLWLSGSGRDTTVQAAPDKSSSHMSSLIAKQKSAPKKRSYAAPSRRGHQTYGRARGHFPPRYSAPLAPKQSQNYSSQLSQYSQMQQRKEAPRSSPESMEPLVVKVEANDRRQVSVAESFSSQKPSSSSQKHKYELPPRLQKAQKNKDTSLKSPLLPVDQNLQSLNGNFHEISVSNEGLSEAPRRSFSTSRGPGQLIAAGRAKKMEALAQLEDLARCQGLSPDVSLDLGNSFNPNNLVPQVELAPSLMPEPVLVPAVDDQLIQKNTDLLLQYCLAQGWCAPEYSVISRHPHGTARPKYFASVSVKTISGSTVVSKCSSLPDEDENQIIAKGYAARKFLKNLQEEEKVKLQKTIISTDKNIIRERISKLVSGAYNGIFAKTVEDMYTQQFREGLPGDWLDMLAGCSTVTVESTLNSTIVLPRMFPTVEPVPAPLEIPTDDTWDVYITYATSTNDVWFRLIGENYSEKYEELLTAMDSYYAEHGLKEQALDICEGQFYAAHSEEGWFRIQVTSVNQEKMRVSACLIDHGEADFYEFNCLFRLPPEFCSLQRQAVQCVLEGLESFADDSFAHDLVANSEHLIGKTFIAQITSFDQETGCVKAVLFDTSGTDDVNVNEKLRESIVFGRANPELPNDGFAMEVHIGTVSKRGEIYVQIPSLAFDHIAEMLEVLGSDEISKHKLTSFRQVALDKMYLAKYKDDCWYRAKVTAQPSPQQNKIAVQFVDFGNAETVSITEIADLENLPLLLKILPPQAVKVALHSLPVETLSNTEIAKLHSMLMASEEKKVLVKTVNRKEDPPVVEMFYKNEADNSALVSVNSTISLSRPTNMPLNALDLNLLKNLNISVGHDGVCTELKRPDLSLDEFLPVIIVLVANPDNFIFQPLKYAPQITALSNQMQAYYHATSLPELSQDQVVKGGLYAARHPEENTWYRAVVTETFLGPNVSVRFCDYGDVMIVSLADLRELETEFRLKPFMAVRGRLSGVVPKHTDWSVEDCIRFRGLVLDKHLASDVKQMDDLGPDPMDLVVSLHLVDTSSDQDLVISEVLIRENRALKQHPPQLSLSQ